MNKQFEQYTNRIFYYKLLIFYYTFIKMRTQNLFINQY